jgi:hydroxymethylpyrimidine pyrophosphatase-like HAD family hydrolase
MKYKLFAIDLDGTLLSKTKHISDKNLQGVKKYIELGGMPVITTGRSIVSSKKFVNQIDNYTKHNSAYIVSFNGAHILNLKNGNVTSFIIPEQLSTKIKEYALQNKLHF